LRTLVATATDAIVEVTKEGKIFNWNDGATALFGYTSAEAIGKPLTILLPESVTSASLTILDLVCRTATIGPIETSLRRSDGGPADVELRVAPIVLPDGRIVAASMVVRDASEKRRADRALQMHADILAHMPVAVVVWRLDDPDNSSSLRLVLANRASRDLVGLSLDERLGARFADVPLGPVDLRDPEPYAAVARSATPHDFGECRLGGAGGVRSYQVKAFPLPDQCVGVAFHDVTERQELTGQLQHAQRMEVIGRIAGGVAHDFNNRLTVITGYADMLRREVDHSQSALERLDEIERAAQSAQQLTRQLLAFSRRQVLRPTNLDLSELVRSARGMLTRVIGEDVELIVIGERPLIVSADAGQIEQVLLNLAINARDAMPAGGKLFIELSLVHLSQSTASDPEVTPGLYAALTVSDTGLGMERATLERVFEPFFTTKEVGKGTGLGLSTVYGIVKQSGGRITVQSEPGQGSTFTIYLPATDAARDQRTSNREVPVALSGSAHHTVLIVDDDESLRALLRRVLTDGGYTVLEARDPEEALRVAGHFTGFIDLLLTDVVMPRQSGAELAARLTVSSPGTRVLYMTGYLPPAATGHRRFPKDARLIHKPFSPGDLLNAIRHALQGDRAHTAPRVVEAVM
jgi:PAS domain S-box-containing protein